MDKSKELRKRLGYTLLITGGATYIIAGLIGVLLMQAMTISLPMVHIIQFLTAVIIGFIVWNILGKEGQLPKH